MKAEFDEIAQQYETMMEKGMVLKGEGNHHAYFTAYKIFYLREIVKAYKRKNQRNKIKVLDYGCGIGILSRAFAKAFPDVIVHGFDISSESIAYANQMEHEKNVTFTSSLEQLDADYDLCICCCVLHHVPPKSRDGVIDNIYQRLKKGGMLLVIEHNMKNPLTRKSVDLCPFDKDAVMLTRNEVACLLEQNAFKKIEKRYITFFPEQFARLQVFDRYLKWCLFGAQHMEIGYKDGR